MEQNLMNLKNEAAPYEGVPENEGMPVAGQQDVAETPYAYLSMGLKKIFGDDFSIDDRMSQDMLLHYLFQTKKQNELLTEVLDSDPRLAQMLLDMINGKRNASCAVARYFGRSLVELDENSPEYQDMLRADEELQLENARMSNDREEYEANLRESQPVIEAFCRERGYNPSEFMDNVWEKIIFPIMAGKYTGDVCTALDHALTYEKDVEDAFAAGDIKGRNTNIMRMKEEFGDGLPKGMSSVAPVAAPKRRRNSLIDKALNA